MRQKTLAQFDIRPFVGALPITFGMHRDEVHRLLGPPKTSSPIWDKSGFSESYLPPGAFNVGYDNAWIVNHAGFCPGSISLSITGDFIWSTERQPDPNPIFLALDPEPVEHLGFWSFLRIGVTTTGYHDEDASQQAITVFPRDDIAYWAAKSKPADTSRYVTA